MKDFPISVNQMYFSRGESIEFGFISKYTLIRELLYVYLHEMNIQKMKDHEQFQYE